MRELPYIIECKSFAAFFEPIAAFNSLAAARWYSDECAATNPKFAYRVTTKDRVISREEG
jgi:hypothetical protein